MADPTGSAWWADFDITLLDHDTDVQATPLNRFGDDVIAGGSDDDMIFGQLGDDTIQGDGITDLAVADDGTAVDAVVAVGTLLGRDEAVAIGAAADDVVLAEVAEDQVVAAVALDVVVAVVAGSIEVLG